MAFNLSRARYNSGMVVTESSRDRKPSPRRQGSTAHAPVPAALLAVMTLGVGAALCMPSRHALTVVRGCSTIVSAPLDHLAFDVSSPGPLSSAGPTLSVFALQSLVVVAIVRIVVQVDMLHRVFLARFGSSRSA